MSRLPWLAGHLSGVQVTSDQGIPEHWRSPATDARGGAKRWSAERFPAETRPVNLRLFARTFALVVCASAVIASAAVGGTKHEPACRPSWFLLSFSYTFHARSIGISGNFNYVGHLGAVCHIPENRPY